MADLHILAREREQAAADVEAAIVTFGAAYQRYERLTETLGARVQTDLSGTRRLDVYRLDDESVAAYFEALETAATAPPDAADAAVAADRRHADHASIGFLGDHVGVLGALSLAGVLLVVAFLVCPVTAPLTRAQLADG